VLFDAADGNDAAIIRLHVLFDLHPVHVDDAHVRPRKKTARVSDARGRRVSLRKPARHFAGLMS
jgi:hypothetical protein